MSSWYSWPPICSSPTSVVQLSDDEAIWRSSVRSSHHLSPSWPRPEIRTSDGEYEPWFFWYIESSQIGSGEDMITQCGF